MSKASFKRMMRERAVQSSRSGWGATPAPLPPSGPRPGYTSPTDEQLANFVACEVNAAAAADGFAARLDPMMAGLMLMASPMARRGWLQRHREFQEAARNLGSDER